MSALTWTAYLVMVVIVSSAVAVLVVRHKAPPAATRHRPRAGHITRADGTHVPLRFVPTGNPWEYLAVTVDGERVVPQPGDEVTVDVIGPGQSVVFDLSP